MILRVCICIPTYDNPETIQAVVLDCLSQAEFPILVIDDGSRVPVASLLTHPVARAALGTGRLDVVRLAANRGKGVALQTGIRECVERGYSHLLAIDGDGQHLASEIPKLVRLALEHPWDLIIGNRRLDAETVPGISKFGRGFSNFWVGYQTDARIADSQSGFRLYPLFHLQGMRFFTRRFDFEIEVMIRLLWKGVGVRETEIAVHYPERGKRVSHFNKLWDNVRISCLNAVLVVLSLLRSRRSAGEIGFAVGVGVLVGCTPFYGFHSVIVAALAFGFRLNAVYAWLGTQISIPPLAPLLALASLRIGTLLTGADTSSMLEFSKSWLLGSLLLGAVLGILIGALSAGFSYSLQRERKRTSRGWSGKTRGGVIGNWIMIQVTRKLGLKAAYFCLRFIIPYFYLFAPKARRSSNEYWRNLRPEAGFLLRQLLVLRQLDRFARIQIDRIYQGASPEPRFRIRSDGIENILEPVRSKQGLILLGAHLGGWDLSAAALKSDGLAGDFHVVRYQAQGITLEKVRGPSNPGHLRDLVVNEQQQPVLELRHLLDAGKPVGLMADRPLGSHFELVTLLGKLAPIDCTPFKIAAACECQLLFTFGFKGDGDEYRFFATKPRRYRYDSGSRALQCQAWAQEFARVLEGFIREYPEQWSNFFPLWSTVPAQASKARNHSVEELRTPATPAPARESDARASAAPGSPP